MKGRKLLGNYDKLEPEESTELLGKKITNTGDTTVYLSTTEELEKKTKRINEEYQKAHAKGLQGSKIHIDKEMRDRKCLK